VPGGPLNLNSTNLPRPWSPRESSPSGKIPTVEPGIILGELHVVESWHLSIGLIGDCRQTNRICYVDMLHW